MKNPKYMKIDELHDYVISLPMTESNRKFFDTLDRSKVRLQKKTYLDIIQFLEKDKENFFLDQKN
jgi:hypothetical protein